MTRLRVGLGCAPDGVRPRVVRVETQRLVRFGQRLLELLGYRQEPGAGGVRGGAGRVD